MTRRRDQEDATIRGLYDRGLDDPAISRQVGLSAAAVGQRRCRLGLPAREDKRQSARQAAKGLSPPPPRQPPNPVDEARRVLGTRVTERVGGYWLDNAPVSCVALVRAANRVLAREGKEMIGPPAWR